MKVALIGANSLTLQYAEKLKSLEAEVHLFWNEKYPDYNSKPLDISLAHALLNNEDKIYAGEVLQISKSTLIPEENPTTFSRFKDLFRVFYEVNPSEFTSKQKLEQPELYQKLNDEFSSSLETSLEMFVDVDLVINTSNNRAHSFLGTGSFTLGERKLTKMLAYPESYQERVFSKSAELKELALVGSGTKAEFVLTQLKTWLKNIDHRLFVISIEENPFEKSTDKEVLTILNEIENEWEKSFKQFELDSKVWDEYDDFVKVKMKKPEEPIPRIVYFSGHNVMAVDRLVDKERYYLTLEKSELRTSIKHAENALLAIKTLAVDQVIVATAASINDHILNTLIPNEKGYFYSPNEFKKNSSQLFEQKKNELEQWIYSLFSKKEVK